MSLTEPVPTGMVAPPSGVSPVGIAPQTQVEPWQSLPPVHADPVPHRQTPPVQVSVVEVSQAAQAAPAVPQAAKLGTWQTPALQQPLGQVALVHWQIPPTHAWPAPQGAPPPHLQVAETQLSDAVVSQLKQAAPPVAPQWAAVGGL